MNTTAYNERIRYFATLLNTIAAAAISIGILARWLRLSMVSARHNPFRQSLSLHLGLFCGHSWQ